MNGCCITIFTLLSFIITESYLNLLHHLLQRELLGNYDIQKVKGQKNLNYSTQKLFFFFNVNVSSSITTNQHLFSDWKNTKETRTGLQKLQIDVEKMHYLITFYNLFCYSLPAYTCVHMYVCLIYICIYFKFCTFLYV